MEIFDKLTTLIKFKLLHTSHLRPFDIFIKKHFNNTNLIGAEIGVLAGVHANCMLHNNANIKKLFLVDPYINYKGYEENYLEVGLNNYYSEAKKRLKIFGERKEFVLHKFQDAFRYIPNNLDFLYYDIHDDINRHLMFFELYYPKIHIGGVIGGWNYDANHHNVSKALTSIVEKYRLKLDGKNNDWWIIKEF